MKFQSDYDTEEIFQKQKLPRRFSYGFISFLFFVTFSSFGFAEDGYKFERMWPTSQQPWFFNGPHGIALDAEGNIYLADGVNNRIQKFNPDGALITTWGEYGNENGQFRAPSWIAIDLNENVYVTEVDNGRVQKFDSAGQFIAQIGMGGSDEGEFDGTFGIGADSDGNIYVVDSGNHRIQKFDSNGKFITKWGNAGSGDGEFNWQSFSHPDAGLAVDQSANIYVVDSGNYRIQKFDNNGKFITKWGKQGSADGEFQSAMGITVDTQCNVYVTDFNNGIQKFTANGTFLAKWGESVDIPNPPGIVADGEGNIWVTDGKNRIQKFTPEGQLIHKWGTDGTGDGNFFSPGAIACDTNGNIYVADTYNDRVQKFSSSGEFIAKWSEGSFLANAFLNPQGITLDNSGNIYVTDTYNNRIQKLTSDGEFILKWGSQGMGDGEFDWPHAIAADAGGNVYVVDVQNDRIQKFTSDGEFISKWGHTGLEDGQFDIPCGIAVDKSGNVYVTDCYEGAGRLQKFDSNGVFITKWGEGWGDPFVWPGGIAVDDNNDIYVTDTYTHCIFKFTSEGRFITQIGVSGNGQGQLSSPGDVCVGPNGSVYAADSANNRIQVFSNSAAPPVETVNKAVIVAGGGSFPGNNIWDATEMCANYAYRGLTYQGYTKEKIYYLSSDTDLDLDGNGKPDDVDADATNASLEYAVSTWAGDADSLLIYMVDHGGKGTFRMGAEEILQATDLDVWLDALQEKTSVKIVMVYDACESGSFLSLLLPPAGKERVLATSSASDQPSVFIANGTVSFSFLFWGHIFNGDSFYDSFVNAKNSIETTYSQKPQIDANGNGIANEKTDKELAGLIHVGKETKTGGDIPVIGGVSPEQVLSGTTSAVIYAENVIDANGISRAWAVITPPGYASGSSDKPVTDLPNLDLKAMRDNRYEATYSNFTTRGTYNIAVYAMDRKGVLSLPIQTSVTVSSLLTACPDCGGENVTISKKQFDADTRCECTATNSITLGDGVKINQGATMIFRIEE